MDRRRLLTAAVAGIIGASAAPTETHANDDRGPIGSWFGTATAVNPPLGQFNDLLSLHAAGVVTESRRYFIPGTPLGNLLETTGHGAWERTRRGLEAFFRFIVQDADTGTAVGTDNVRLELVLNRRGDMLTGTFTSQIRDLTDAVVVTVTGDYVATRIEV